MSISLDGLAKRIPDVDVYIHMNIYIYIYILNNPILKNPRCVLHLPRWACKTAKIDQLENQLWKHLIRVLVAVSAAGSQGIFKRGVFVHITRYGKGCFCPQTPVWDELVSLVGRFTYLKRGVFVHRHRYGMS